MSNTILQRKRIRMALDIAKMDGPKDKATGGTPSSWLGNDVQFECGVFYGTVLLDISLVASVTLLIKDAVASTTKLVEKIIPAAQFDLTCDATTWADDSKQQITIDVARSEMNLPLGTGSSKIFWLAIYALTTASPAEEITLCAGNFELKDDGNLTPGEVAQQEQTFYSAGDSDARFVQKHEDQAWMRFYDGRWYHFIQSTGLWYPEIAEIKDDVPVLTLGTGVAL